jgi:hypothetical protein
VGARSYIAVAQELIRRAERGGAVEPAAAPAAAAAPEVSA